jgi:hypothetical protein
MLYQSNNFPQQPQTIFKSGKTFNGALKNLIGICVFIAFARAKQVKIKKP